MASAVHRIIPKRLEVCLAPIEHGAVLVLPAFDIKF